MISELKSPDEFCFHRLLAIAAYGGPFLADCFEWLREKAWLDICLPEIAALIPLPENPKLHPEGGTYAHVLACLRSCDSTTDATKTLAVAMHDIGKPLTLTIDEYGPHYRTHELAGLAALAEMSRRLRMPAEMMTALASAIEYHMYGHRLASLDQETILELRRHPQWQVIAHVIYCDRKSRGPKHFCQRQFDSDMARIEAVYQKFCADDILWATPHVTTTHTHK